MILNQPIQPNLVQIIGLNTTDKKERKNPLSNNVKFSFYITYVLLLTTATITFIEALRTPYPYVRHIFNLETAISLVAGFFYSVFVAKIDEYNEKDLPIDWKEITNTRYIDWAITTPMMLLALCSVLAFNSKIVLKWTTMLTIVILNYFMLFVGYLGETGTMERYTSMFVGFIAFFAMFFIILSVFIYPKNIKANNVVFSVFVVVWSMYGIVYLFSEESKNIFTNVLDLIAKCFVGIGLWLYYSKLLQ
jgi:bacteriorhodopsin